MCILPRVLIDMLGIIILYLHPRVRLELCNSVVMPVSCSVLHSEYLDGLVVLISRYIRHKILSVITSLSRRPKTLIIRDE